MNALQMVTSTQDGWFYSENYNHAQKVNEGVYCYVSHLIFGYMVQLYLRGDVYTCKLEARTSDTSHAGIIKMFELGEQWLEEYQTGDLSKIMQNRYSVSNPEGVWREGSKEYWI